MYETLQRKRQVLGPQDWQRFPHMQVPQHAGVEPYAQPLQYIVELVTYVPGPQSVCSWRGAGAGAHQGGDGDRPSSRRGGGGGRVVVGGGSIAAAPTAPSMT